MVRTGSHRGVVDMGALVARQPILTLDGVTVGYELLHRPAEGGSPSAADGDAATASVLVDGVLGHGLARLTAGLPVWVNVPERFLVEGGLDAVVGHGPLVVEVLEGTRGTPEVRHALQDLRRRGIRVALDDVTAADPRTELLDLVDVVKIDLMATTPAQRAGLVEQARSRHVEVLYEKVEGAADVAEAGAVGADLVQGYHFARPTTAGGGPVAIAGANRLRLLRLVTAADLDLDAIDGLIRQDLYLAHRFLALVNSAAFGWRHRVSSIAHGLVLLGRDPLRRWLGLVVMATLAPGRPSEFLVTAATRARLLESLAEPLGRPDRALDLFALGMFSVLGEALGGTAVDEHLGALGLPDDVHAALLGRPSALADLLSLARGLEVADWSATTEAAARLGLHAEDVDRVHRDALRWGLQARSAADA